MRNYKEIARPVQQVQFPVCNFCVNQAFHFLWKTSTCSIGNRQQMAQQSDAIHG